MGAAKDMWMDEVERVGEQFGSGAIDRTEALTRLIRLGFDRHEAETMLDEVMQ